MNSIRSKSGQHHMFYNFATLLLLLALLYFAKPVLIPIALSVLLAFILTPLVIVLEGWRLGRLASVLIASGLTFCTIGIAVWALGAQVRELANDLPNHTQEIKAKIASLKMSDNSTFGRLTGMFNELFPVEDLPASNGEFVADNGTNSGSSSSGRAPVVVLQKENGSSISSATEILLPVVEPFATAALVIVLVMFLLLRREDVRYRMISLMGDSALTGTTRLMRETAERVSKYLLHLLMVNTAFGIWFGIGLWFLDVPYAPLWGFLTLCFRFIPFLGAPASLLFPLLMSVATAKGWSQPVWIVLFFSVSELLTSNIVEPVLFGKTTGLTSIALLIAALFWAWIWGPIGLLLSTPMTVCLVVLGQHLPHLRSFRVLLAEQPALESNLQYFHRLLARDVLEGQRIIDTHAEQFGVAGAFDDVILPALNWTRRERAADSIDADEEKFIWHAARNSVQQTIERLPLPISEPGTICNSATRCRVFGYPVHHEAEEVSLMMLQELIQNDCEFALCSTRQLPTRVISEMAAQQPDVIVLAVMPPGGLPQVRYMCSELQVPCPDSQIIVACFGRIKRYDQLLVKLRRAGASYLTTSLQQTIHQIETLRGSTTVIDSDAKCQSVSVVSTGL